MTGHKTCRKQSIEWIQHETYWWMEWDMVLKECVSFMTHLLYAGTPLFNLHSCILSILFFIIPDNVDTLNALYFYVCRWKLKKRKTIEPINKKFSQITQSMQVSQAPIIVPTKNDDAYLFFMLMQADVYFEIIVCEM